MALHLITYGTGEWEPSAARLGREARSSGAFATVTVSSPKDLPPSFVAATKPYIDDPIGGGWWLWKPHLVLSALSSVKDGDVVFYADAGCTLRAGAGDKLEEMACFARERGVASTELPHHLEKDWTHERLFEQLQVPRDSQVRETGQRIATYFAVGKTRSGAEGISAVYHWYSLAKAHPALFAGTVPGSRKEEHHRHDQSVLSVLLKLGGIPPFPREQGDLHPCGCFRSDPFWSTRTKAAESIKGAA